MKLGFTRNFYNFLIFILLASLWGGSYIAIKFAVLKFPPVFSAMWRLIIAQLALTVFLYFISKPEKIPFQMRWKMWLIGLFPLGFPFALLFWAERFISPGLAGILGGTTPIWVVIISFIFLPQLISFSVTKLLGLVMGLAGVCIIFWPMINVSNLQGEIWGSAAVLGMALCYAIGALLNQRYLLGKISSPTLVKYQNFSSMIFLIIVSLLLESWPSGKSLMHAPTFWLASIYLGVFSTAIAWVLYYHLIHSWGAMRASTATYMAPIMALFWDALFFGRYPKISEVIGIVIILASISLIQFTKNT